MYIYLHVPFCQSHCIYCDFFVVLEKYGGQSAYVDAVCQEIRMRMALQKPETLSKGIETLYIGGGTPSLLPADAYTRVFDTLREYTHFQPDAEITIEANPGATDTAMASPASAYLDVGFNRISVGVQSFQDAELRKLSRIHSADNAVAFIRNLQKHGWHNISLDLMYSLPLQTMKSWEETLHKAITLNVQHISMYGLKVEEGTPLEKLAKLPTRAGYSLPPDDTNVDMYFRGIELLESAGFSRYEFSNLSKPGMESRHNLNYWSNGDYLALGASAHGYVNHERYENVRSLAGYLNNPLAGERQICTLQERLENAIIFGLRRIDGIDIQAIEAEFNIDFHKKYARILNKYSDFLMLENSHLKFPLSAIPVSNGILSEFMEL